MSSTEKPMLYFHKKMSKQEIDCFFGHVEGPKKSIGLLIHPRFHSTRGGYEEFRKKLDQTLENRKFPTIALVGPNKMKEVGKWLAELHRNKKLRKPVMVMETAHWEKPDPEIGFEELANMLHGRVKNVYVYGEIGVIENREEIQAKINREEVYREPEVKKEIEKNRKRTLTAGCVAGAVYRLREEAEKHDFQVHYLPEKIKHTRNRKTPGNQ